MNPWLILGVAVLVGAAAWGGYEHGHDTGINEQKVADQGEFDGINKALADQKKNAALRLFKAMETNTAILVERDKLKTQLGEQDAQRRVEIAALHAKYAGNSLRFQPKPGDGGTGSGGGRAEAPRADTPSDASAAYIQLPDEIAGNLRELAFEADELNADYTKCYGYATKVR